MKKHTLFIILIIGIALAIGVWRDHHESGSTIDAKQFNGPLPLNTGTALPQAQALPQFNFTDMNSQPFTNANLKNHWSFVFFGYTSCPNICPTILGSLHQLSQRLHGGSTVQFIFITIDPANDTPARLKEYLQQAKFHLTHFIGLTGNIDETHQLAKSIGVHFAKERNISAEHIEHGGTLILVNPQGQLAAIFTSSDKPHLIAHDFKEIVHQYAKNA